MSRTACVAEPEGVRAELAELAELAGSKSSWLVHRELLNWRYPLSSVVRAAATAVRIAWSA